MTDLSLRSDDLRVYRVGDWMGQRTKTFRDFWAAMARRRMLVMGAMLLISLIGTLIAFGLPSVYQSSATLLLQQEHSQDRLDLTTMGYAEQRVELIGRQVLTSTRLKDLIERYDLYASDREKQPFEAIVNRMRDDITMEPVSTDLFDRRGERPAQTSVAFTLGYNSHSPDFAQKIADELVALLLIGDIEGADLSSETILNADETLGEEARRLKARVAELDQQLADFKARNRDKFPDQLGMNLELINRTEGERKDIGRQIGALQERKISLEAQAARFERSSTPVQSEEKLSASTSARLNELQTRYISRSAVFGPKHPEIVRLRKEIAALEKEVGASDATSALRTQLATLQSELRSTKQKFSPAHPDVRRLERSIANVQEELNKALTIAPEAQPTPADDPALKRLQAQLRLADTELKALRTSYRELQAKRASYEQRLAQTPAIQSEFSALSREYSEAAAKYQNILATQQPAYSGGPQNSAGHSRHVSLIDPPLVPEHPLSPNRMAILMWGLMIAFVGGLSTGAVAESMDNTLKSSKDVAALLGTAPLASIPLIQTPAQSHRKALVRAITPIAITVGLAILLAWIHWRVTPLGDIWSALLGRLGL